MAEANAGNPESHASCLFCKIVHKQLPAWVVGEDAAHLAFLTPFPNTPGVTVVIPKAHVGDNLFRLSERQYELLLAFARNVARVLEDGLRVARVAMIVEGTGIPHAHVKLYPLHGPLASQTGVWSATTEFTEEYRGWLTTYEGPRMPDSDLDRIRAVIGDALLHTDRVAMTEPTP